MTLYGIFWKVLIKKMTFQLFFCLALALKNYLMLAPNSFADKFQYWSSKNGFPKLDPKEGVFGKFWHLEMKRVVISLRQKLSVLLFFFREKPNTEKQKKKQIVSELIIVFKPFHSWLRKRKIISYKVKISSLGPNPCLWFEVRHDPCLLHAKARQQFSVGKKFIAHMSFIKGFIWVS